MPSVQPKQLYYISLNSLFNLNSLQFVVYVVVSRVLHNISISYYQNDICCHLNCATNRIVNYLQTFPPIKMFIFQFQHFFSIMYENFNKLNGCTYS